MGNIKFYKTAVALLLLLNIGTLVFMWAHRPPPPAGAGAFMFLVKATNMDKAQIEAYEQLKTAHRVKMDAFRAQNGQLRGKLFELMSQHGSNDPAVALLMDSIASSRRQEEIVTYDHFREVRAICRPDQQAKFDAAIGEAVQSMGPSEPRRR